MPRKKQLDDKPLSFEQASGRIAKAVRNLLVGNDPGMVTFRLQPTRPVPQTDIDAARQHIRGLIVLV